MLLASRDRRGGLQWEALIQDIGYSLRRLRKAPGFALVAVATLALGIGANAAIFSAVNAVLLRPLPYPEAERLVVVNHVWKGQPAVVSPQNFLDFETETKSFDALAVYDTDGATLTGRGEPVQLPTGETSASFFEVLRVTPTLGRAFRPGENEPGQNHVVVLSQGLWRERFGGDPCGRGPGRDPGRRAPHDRRRRPPGFDFPRGRSALAALSNTTSGFAPRAEAPGTSRPSGVSARGSRPSRRRAEAATIGARLAFAYPDANEGLGLTVRPLQEAMVGKVRTPLFVLLGAVGLVLLIACANVANLLLSRAAAREGELAVRSAMGAGRGRLVRQLLTEASVLGALGAAAGLVVAAWGGDLILALQPRDVPRLDEIRLDRVVVAFTVACAFLTTVVFGTIPAILATRRSSAVALREGGRGLLSGRGGRVRRGLAVAEMALAVTLLAGAGLLLRSFSQLSQVDPGFQPDSALVFRLGLPEARYPEGHAQALFYRQGPRDPRRASRRPVGGGDHGHTASGLRLQLLVLGGRPARGARRRSSPPWRRAWSRPRTSAPSAFRWSWAAGSPRRTTPRLRRSWSSAERPCGATSRVRTRSASGSGSAGVRPRTTPAAPWSGWWGT